MIALLALAASIGIAGCTNDGGGPAGPDGGGDTGQTGPTGPTGPADVPISLGGDVRNVGTGSTLTAQQIADIGTLVASIDSAAITGNKPVIEITVKTDKGGAVLGLAATTLRLGVAKLVPAANGFPSRWQSYINRSGAPSIATPALASAVQANTESGVAAGWQELGAGKYRYTSAVDLSTVTTPIAVTYEPSLTHRISVAIDLTGSARALAPDNPFKDFVPNGGARHLEQAHRRDRQLHNLPRALRRTRRATPQRRILRGLPQPGHDRPGLGRVRRPRLHGAFDPSRRRPQHGRTSCMASTARDSTPAKSPIRSRSRSAKPATSSRHRCRTATTGRRIRARHPAAAAMTPA